MAAARRSVTVSAPGKVLITGGYLVTDRAHTGLVLVTDAAFRTTVSASDASDVVIASPQFGWSASYSVHVTSDRAVALTPSASSAPNKYVQMAVLSALAVAVARSPDALAGVRGARIEILGGNDFYSQRDYLASRGLPLTVASLRQVPAFNALPKDAMTNLRKTGLGSSAALVTSVTAAILVYLGTATLDNDLALIHNTAQYAHCLAQGRIGSGFDVSSATYGSHAYRRFSYETIEGLLPLGSATQSPPIDALAAVVAATWDCHVSPFTLPRGCLLVLGDIDAGSNTPSLVRLVMDWKSRDPNANALWAELSQANDLVATLLGRLVGLSKDDAPAYEAAVAQAAQTVLRDSTDARLEPFAAAASAFDNVRRLLRAMGDASGAPIEPPEQTALLDACMRIPGVLFGGVPGAGGYDAVFCIVIGEAAREAVFAQWTASATICPLLAGIGDKGLALVD